MNDQNELKWILQALAVNASAQIKLFPDFANAADELAIAWEEFYRKKTYISTLSENQQALLSVLNASLEEMSGEDNIKYWSSDALIDAVEWSYIRVLAVKAIELFNWSVEVPHLAPGIYVDLSKK